MLKSLQQRLIAGGFVLASVVIVLLFSLAYRSNSRFAEWNKLAAHTRDVLRSLDEFSAAVKGAQAAAVGFYASGNETQVKAFAVAESQVHAALAHLKTLTADSEKQQRNLELLLPAADQALALLQSVIDLRRAGKSGTEALKPINEEAKRITPPLVNGLAAMTSEENQLLETRTAIAGVESRRATRLQLVGGILAGAIVLSLFFLFLRESSVRARAEKQLAEANTQLEARVAERTNELQAALAQVRRQSEEPFRLFVSNVKDYALLMLDPNGNVTTWNAGAERIKGYSTDEIVGQHFSRFYTWQEAEQGVPGQILKKAADLGTCEIEGWRVRKDGSRFWASVTMTALRGDDGVLRGFGSVIRDMTERKILEDEMAAQNAQLESTNHELEAFSYSVSHDLRAPLRGIDGFSQALLEDCGGQLDEQARDYLGRVRAGVQRMGMLIDDLLNLSRITRSEMRTEQVNLSEIAQSIAEELRGTQPDRPAEFVIRDGVEVKGDSQLMRVALQNLLSNSWKFTSKRPDTRIEFGRIAENGSSVFYVKDNGAGFDPAYSKRLFGAFQRLHANSDFPGTGIGLATVQRVVRRHGGKIWAESEVGHGATFFFTLLSDHSGKERV